MVYEVAKGDKFRHYKGGLYKILALATHTELQEGLVIYKDEQSSVWARPVEMFFGYLEDGRKRFELINDDEQDILSDFDPFE